MLSRSVARAAGIFSLSVILGVFCMPAPAAVTGYHFILHDVEARPGDRVELAVDGAHERAVQGFAFAARFPADRLTIERVQFEDTILEAMETDYFEVRVDSERGEITIGALVDSEPPFSGALIPAIGRPLRFFTIEATLDAEAEADVELALANGIGEPPIDNIYAVDNFPVPVDELAAAVIRLPIVEVPLFVRGDTTLDESMDVSDAVVILDWQFRGGRAPRCLDAADVNDDRSVDVSDAIFLLGYLFLGSGAPPPPQAGPGPDPTPDDLGCDDPIAFERRLAE